jgi:hypothetical protein
MARARQAALLFVLLPALTPTAGAVPGTAAREAIAFGPQPSLTIGSLVAGVTEIAVGMSLSPTAAQVARVAVYVPDGYTLRSPPAGASVGSALMLGTTPGSISSSGYVGTLVVADPARIDPAAQACDPGVHLSVWQATLSSFDNSQTMTMPMFVDATGLADPAGAAYRLQFCPTLPAGQKLVAVDMLLGPALGWPGAAADYLWRAYLTPFALGGTTPDPTQTYELRALVPFPQALTLSATYDAKTQRAVLKGQVTELGKPKAGVSVQLAAHSKHVEFADFGPARTDARGRYSITWPISEKTSFTASVEPPDLAPCPASPSPPPGGCSSITTSTPADQTAIARPPRKTDPRQLIRPADAGLAGRIAPRLSDFPEGWHAQAGGSGEVFPCPDFAPSEARLTLTGTASSQIFFTGLGGDVPVQLAASIVKVWKTSADARAAFAQEAPARQLRCLLQDPKTRVANASVLRLPRYGRATAAYRAVLVDQDESGNRVSSYVDVVVILGRRSLTTLLFLSEAAPPSAEAAVTRAVGARASRG